MSVEKITEQQKEWTLKIAAGLLVFFLCYASMIHPAFQDSASLIQGIRGARQRIELYQNIRDLQGRLQEEEDLLPVLTERAQILGKISDMAAQQKIRVQKLTPKTEPMSGYSRLRIEMDGQGSYLSLIKFLQDIEKFDGVIKARDVSALVKPQETKPKEKAEDKADLLQLRILLETFLKPRIRKNV